MKTLLGDLKYRVGAWFEALGNRLMFPPGDADRADITPEQYVKLEASYRDMLREQYGSAEKLTSFALDPKKAEPLIGTQAAHNAIVEPRVADPFVGGGGGGTAWCFLHGTYRWTSRTTEHGTRCPKCLAKDEVHPAAQHVIDARGKQAYRDLGDLFITHMVDGNRHYGAKATCPTCTAPRSLIFDEVVAPMRRLIFERAEPQVDSSVANKIADNMGKTLDIQNELAKPDVDERGDADRSLPELVNHLRALLRWAQERNNDFVQQRHELNGKIATARTDTIKECAEAIDKAFMADPDRSGYPMGIQLARGYLRGWQAVKKLNGEDDD